MGKNNHEANTPDMRRNPRGGTAQLADVDDQTVGEFSVAFVENLDRRAAHYREQGSGLETYEQEERGGGMGSELF